jgi:predicted PurR-regulated permease PerM
MLAAVVVVVAALYFAQAVLMPVAMAIFLSFVLSPLVSRVERWRLGRVPSVVVVVLLAFTAIGSVSWVVGRQAMDMAARLPEYRENLDAKFALVREKLHGPFQRASDAVHSIEQSAAGEATGHAGVGTAPTRDAAAPAAPAPAASDATTMMSWATVSLGTFLSVTGMAGVVVLLVIIMLVQRGDVRDRFIALAGGGVVVTTQALDEAAQRLSRYLLVLTIINASYGTAIGAGLCLIGVPNWLLWGILAGSLRFIPYVGPLIAASLPILFSFVISDGLTMPLLACALFVGLELLTNMVVEPTVLPHHIGVSTTALVVSAVFWTWLWGAPGLVLATPLTVCVAVMGNHIPRMRFLSVILSDQSALSPSLRVYQRLLVADTEDAWSLVAAELKGGRSVVEIFDSLLLPALCLAQQDRRDRVIDDATLAKVAERARELAEEVVDRDPAKSIATEAGAGTDEGNAAVVPRGPLRVVCVAAEKEVDGAASSMLCAILRRAGIDATEAARGGLVGEALDFIGSVRPAAVCVSQIPPLSFMRLRYVCKRIAERHPGIPILVGTWTMSLDPARVQERLESNVELRVAGTLAEMVQHVEKIAAHARSEPQLATPERV